VVVAQELKSGFMIWNSMQNTSLYIYCYISITRNTIISKFSSLSLTSLSKASFENSAPFYQMWQSSNLISMFKPVGICFAML
jgi:hypothetical protein